MKITQSKTILLPLFYFFALTVSAQQWGDYTLYSVQNSSTAYLVDTNGTTFKTWTFTTSQKTGYSSYLMPGGILWRTVINTGNSFNGGGMTGKVQKVDYSGTILWDYTHSSTTYCLHHDICPLPNGNVLMIAYESKTAAQATQAGSSQAITIWSEKIIEVQPTGTNTGNIVWEWHAWDHLVQNNDPSKDNYQASIVNHPELLNINYNNQKDLWHMNGLDYNPVLDQIAVSSHNWNEVYIIDHSTTTAEAATHSGGNAGKGGDILYRWGNPATYGASGTTNFNVVHDAHWIPEGCPNAGYLSGFNNKGISTTQAAVDEVQTPRIAYNYTITPGSAFGPSTYTKRTAATGGTSNMGNAQQLPNGNMLITLALSGTMYEINSVGTVLWTKTATGNVPQSHRYAACYVNNAAPATPVVSQNGTQLTSTSGVTYQWYLNGDPVAGETNQSITAAQDGIYVVRITDSNGCVYAYSAGFAYSTSTGIKNAFNSDEVSVYPNPTTGMIFIGLPQGYADTKVLVFDSFGRLLLNNNNVNTLDLSPFENGIYFISINTPSGKIIKRISLSK